MSTEVETGRRPQVQDDEMLSAWTQGWRRFKQHRFGVYGSWVLLFMYIFVTFCGFFAPYNETRAFRREFYHPPVKIHFTDENGRLTRPYIYDYRMVNVARRQYEVDTSKKYPIRFFVRGDSYKLFWVIPTNIHLLGVDEPANLFLLGTDQFGRDLFSRIAYGGSRTLYIPVLAIVISFVLGMLIGGVSGYFGGTVDNILMRIVELIQSIPSFYLLLALAGTLQKLPVVSSVRFFLIVLILSLIGWGSLARVIRGLTLSLREREFVLAARALGASSLRVILRHIVPNTFSYTIIALSLSFPGYILSESAISLLGLGVQEPIASWGNLLSPAQRVSVMKDFPWILTPGVFIFVAILMMSFVGDALRDAFDPRVDE